MTETKKNKSQKSKVKTSSTKDVIISSYEELASLSEKDKQQIILNVLPDLMKDGKFWVRCIKCNMLQSILEVKKRKCNQCGKIKPADLEVLNASKDIN